ELATGESPFVGKGFTDTLHRISLHHPQAVHRLRNDLSPELSRLVEHLLEKDPELRPRGASEVASSLAMLSRRFTPLDETGPLPVLGPGDDTLGDPTDFQAAIALPALAGRTAELEQLGEVWAEARAGKRQVVFVTGEAGIGKSALVHEFLHRSESDALIAEGRCLEFHGSAEAYLPLLDILGRLCRGDHGRSIKHILLQWAPSWLLQLPWAIDDGAERDEIVRRALGAGPARMLTEFVEAADALSRRRPLLFVIEDLHWSDLSTLDLLSALARRPDPARLMVIATVRTSEMVTADPALPKLLDDLRLRRLAMEMPLGLLDLEGVRELLADRLEPDSLTPALVKRVHRQSGGNPLFTLHLADMVAGSSKEPGRAGPGAGGRGGGNTGEGEGGKKEIVVSRDLLQILEGLIRRASPEEQRFLETASVAGERFFLPAVADALGQSIEECETVAEALAERGAFLRRQASEKLADGGSAKVFAFLHDIYRQALHGRLTTERRREIHGTVASALEELMADRLPQVAGQLAHHFEEGGSAERAVGYRSMAAATALGRSAYREALMHLRRGEHLLEQLGAKGPISGELADSPPSPELLARRLGLALQLGTTLIATSGFSDPEAAAVLAEAESLAETLGDPRRRFYALCGRWVFRWMRAEIPKSLELARRAQELAGTPYEQILGHAIAGASLLRQGSPAAALDQFRAAVAFDMELDLQAVFESFPLVEGRVFSRVFGALSLWWLGHVEEAREWAFEGNRSAMELGHAFSQLNTSSVASTLFLLNGELDRSRELHRRMEAISKEQGFPLSLTPMVRAVLYETEPLAAGARLAAVEKEMREARSRGQIVMQNVDLLMLTLARRHAGRLGDALEAAREGQQLAEATGDRWYLAELLRLDGELLVELGQPRAEAEALFRRAIEVAEEQGAASWRDRAAESLAKLVG
ncbi:MAG: AAA family ATPase, partial [Holophagales bacterium]|nr:AAA family ATPase [Holophagales bacterium]